MNNIYLLLFLLTLTLFILGLYYNSQILKVLSLISCLTLVILFAVNIKNINILSDTTEYEWSSPETTLIYVTPDMK